MSQVVSHHLIYGTLNDYITGEELQDTDDERFRQQLARTMVEEKGYAREELQPRRFIETLFSSQFVRSTIELTVSLDNRCCMVIRYGPGSLVSRERSAVAAARILEPDYQIPLAVVTNGRDAELISTDSGEILAKGLEQGIPSRDRAVAMLPGLEFQVGPTGKKREQEMRILNAFDIEICCR